MLSAYLGWRFSYMLSIPAIGRLAICPLKRRIAGWARERSSGCLLGVADTRKSVAGRPTHLSECGHQDLPRKAGGKDCRHRGERADSPVTCAAESVVAARGTSSMSPCQLVLGPGEVVGAGRGSCRPGLFPGTWTGHSSGVVRARQDRPSRHRPDGSVPLLACCEAWSRSPCWWPLACPPFVVVPPGIGQRGV